MSLLDVIVDLGIISVLMLIGVILRRHVKIFQKYYIPAPLIGGTIGMLFNSSFLGKVLPFSIPFSGSIGQWSVALLCVMFAASFLGAKFNKVVGSGLQTFFLGGVAFFAQNLLGVVLAFLIIKTVLPEMYIGVGLLPQFGFFSGHGAAALPAGMYDTAGLMGLDDTNALGATFATVGLVTGIVFGMILINRAARKGKTTIKMRPEDVPENVLTGYNEPGKREELGKAVTSSGTLDPLATQLMMIGIVILLAKIMMVLLTKVAAIFGNIGLFPYCLVCSFLVGFFTRNNKRISDMIDRKTIVHISGAALDLMTTAVIANTSLSVFVTYAVPLIVMSVAMILLNYFICFVLSKRFLPKGEGLFETQVGLFGQVSGVLATGLMLLKVVDPENVTNGASNIQMGATLCYTYTMPFNIILLPLFIKNPLAGTLAFAALMVAFVVVGLINGKKYQNG